MSHRRLFICYSRADVEAVEAVAAECTQLGQDVWLDQRLSGGQQWWDTILDHIRQCDCFLFALSPASLQSRACRAELGYANALRRPLLPVVVGDAVPDQLLPPYLAQTQRVDPRQPYALARALVGLAPAPPLGATLPPPPLVPISYLDELVDVVERRELTLAEQRNLVGELKGLLAGEDQDGALALLQRLQKRSDVYASVASEIDEIVRTLPARQRAPNAPFLSPPTGPRPDQSNARRPRRTWLVVVTACAVLIGLGAVVAAATLGGGDGEEDSERSTATVITDVAPNTEDVGPGPEGLALNMEVRWDTPDGTYGATVSTDGTEGAAYVVVFDSYGNPIGGIQEDLTVGRDAEGVYLAGSNPTLADGTPASDYQPDVFRLARGTGSEWYVNQVCDISGCYQARSSGAD